MICEEVAAMSCQHLFAMFPIFPVNLETSTQTLQSLYDCNLSADIVTGGTFIYTQPSLLPYPTSCPSLSLVYL